MDGPPPKRPRRGEDHNHNRSNRDERPYDRSSQRDSHYDRDRRYRSRSRERGTNYRERDNRDNRDDRDRESRNSRGSRGGRHDETRERGAERERGGRDRDRDSHRERERDGRDRDGRGGRGDAAGNTERERERRRGRDSVDREKDRSRSPKGETRGGKAAVSKGAAAENVAVRSVEEDIREGRTATPPVTFSIGRRGSMDKERAVKTDEMDIDDGSYAESSSNNITQSNGTKSSREGAKIGRKSVKKQDEEPAEDEEDIIVEQDDAMAAMQAMMGFGGFGTTKQKKVAGNDVGAIRKEKKMEYRQYMNRVGGFNRPLSPSRET